MVKEHILHLRRHMAAREPLFIGEEITVPRTTDKAIVGNGVHPDSKAHLQAGEYSKAETIGKKLYVPSNVSSLLVAPSPLERAGETARHMFIGMCDTYAKTILAVNPENLSEDEKRLLSKSGLHKLATFRHLSGLIETNYRNSQGQSDEGNELVAEAYNKMVNPNFPGYKWMVQKGFELDPRSEYPQFVADRALTELVPDLLVYDVVLSATHQPNLEIITAVLTGNLGKEGNETFENAGGSYGMGGGFELRVYEDQGRIETASLVRTLSDPTTLDKVLNVDIDTIRRYA